MRWALEAGRRNSRSAKRITYFVGSKIVVATPPTDAKTSVMSLLRPWLVVSSALSKKATLPRFASGALHLSGCERYRAEGARNSKRASGVAQGHNMEGLRGRSGATARRSARTGPSGNVPPTTVPPDVRTEGGREAAATCDRGSGRQDCPGGHGHRVQRHL